MPTYVSRNTIKLPSTASSVDDYYINHNIELKRIDSFGKEITQIQEIIDYDGANRIATIGGLWESDFTPATGDTYEITPKFKDGRVSINPAIQCLDYITSKTYGRGLNALDDLDLVSWLDSGRKCDTPSDIYIKFTGSSPSVGDKYILSSPNIWQGTVAEIIGSYIRFTDVIGKLSYYWNNWRSFKVGQLIWTDNKKLYEVTSAGVKVTKPSHTSGTVSGLMYLSSKNITKVSGDGPATIPLYVDGNPVRYEKNGVPISGYTLYDSDGIDYFRYIGWDTNEQRSVTRHQTNLSIDTSLPLFDNMNSMLQHFGGILRYSGDKYVLEVEEMEGEILDLDEEPRNITSDHIIGKISIQDDGIKNAFNSLTASYTDPANRFEARNISFFNSDYLKADRNVAKKGNVTIPGITNYYNARLLADKYLTRSRYGLTISMNIAPRGVLLLAGKVIQLQYPRYGWNDKKFRIENLTHNDDCTVDIVATEYDDSFYVISNIAKSPAQGLAGSTAITTLESPSNLVATNNTSGNEMVSAIQLTWENVVGISPLTTIEIYGSYSPHLFIEIESITGGTTFTTVENPHGLAVGQVLKSLITDYGLDETSSYYVRSVTATTFTLAATKGGPAISTFGNTTDNFKMQTASVIANLNPPANSYVDTEVYSISSGHVDKYYWLRYKIDQS